MSHHYPLSSSHPALRPVAHPTAAHHRIRTSSISRPTRPPPSIPVITSPSTTPTPISTATINTDTKAIIDSMDRKIQLLETNNRNLAEQLRQLQEENQQLKEQLDIYHHRPATPSAPPMYDPRWLDGVQPNDDANEVNDIGMSNPKK